MSNPMGDRNLLAGILAYQKKFISREVLVAALNAWTQAKEKGLAQILREQQALTENQHALLEEAVCDQLAKHGNDAKNSLAALNSDEPIKQELAKIADADLQTSVRNVGTAEPEVPIVAEEVVEIKEAPKKKPAPGKAATVGHKKNAAPAGKSAGGISVLVLLVGGAIVGGCLALVALMGVGLAFFLLRGEKPIAQVKPDDAPIIRGKEENKGDDKPPIKELDRGAKQADPPIDPGPLVQFAPPPDPEGFVPLFNGKDLTGWKVNKAFPGSWRVDNGVLSGAAENSGRGILETEKMPPRDFHLRIETRINAKGAGFVNFRAMPEHKFTAGYTTSINAWTKGLEQAGLMGIQTLNGGYRSVPQLREVPLFRPQPGEWFTLEIICQGNRLITKVNGVERVDVIDATFNEAGNIALITVTPAAIEFRKIEIKELNNAVVAPPPAPVMKDAPPFPVEAGFVSLFNGKDLTGWKERFAGGWRIDKGVLIGSAAANRTAVLHTDAKFKDFHLRAEVRSGAKNLAKLGFRSADGFLQGYNASMISLPAGDVRVGIINANTGRKGFTLPRLGPEQKIPPGRWFNLEVIAQGNRFIVLVNGKKTTDAADASMPDAGFICLSLSGAEPIEFRKIEIKEFNAVVAPPPMPPAGAAPFPVDPGFAPLFNGKDLTGWKLPVGFADAWRVEKGVLIGAAPPQRLIRLHTEAKFKDFHLRAEMRSGDKNVAHVGFRSSDGIIRGYNTGVVSMGPGGGRAGVLNCNTPMKNFGVAGPGVAEKIPPGQWFNLEVIAQGNRFMIFVDGKKTVDVVDDTVPDAGFIYLGLSGKETLEFRKLEIKAADFVAAPPAKRPEVFVPLFNGKDLTGWQPHAKRPGNWRVENGILIGSAPNGGSLYSTRGDYHDFHLRAEVRINDKGFGRIFGRAAYDPTKIPAKVLGYEVLINQRPLGDKTGTLTATSPTYTSLTPAKELPAPAGDWLLVEVIAKGDLVTVKVNGNTVAEFRDERRQIARSGHIALHQDANATIEFRKVEIGDLSAR